MRSYRIIIPVALLFISVGCNVFSQENKFRIGGEIYMDNRFRLENGEWSWNENRLDLELEKKFPGQVTFYSDIWLRTFGFPMLTNADQLFNKDETSPYNLEIREAYVQFSDFLVKKLDLKVGRQRIAWGTGDKLNPTDNVNAYDLEDIWDFGRHLGSDGIKATYYFGDFKIEGNYIFFFRPAALPRGDWTEALIPGVSVPAYFTVVSLHDTLVMPALKLGQSDSYALKFGGYLKGFDFSVSYLFGRDCLPINDYNTITPLDTLGSVSLTTQMIYPRQHVIGADFAGSAGKVGIWAEAGAFLPEHEVVMTTDLSALFMPSKDTVILEKELYVKYLAGMDYTFRDGSYINFQYLHGFMNERGNGNLNDYFVVDYRKEFFNQTFRINPATVAYVVGDWKDISGDFALIYSPSIMYKPNDDTEIMLGIRLLWGEGDNTFSRVADKDEFFLSVRYGF